MSKWKIVLICLSVGIIVGAVVGSGVTWKLTRCERSGQVDIVDPGTPSDPVYHIPAATACGHTIDITGAMSEGRFFTVKAANKCMTVTRAFELAGICRPLVRPYSLMIQGHALAGYSQELQKFNALIGATLSWLWNYSRGSVGVGATYLRGIVIKEWYAGATVTGKLDFGKIK